MEPEQDIKELLKERFSNPEVKSLSLEIYNLADGDKEILKKINWEKPNNELIKELQLIKENLTEKKKRDKRDKKDTNSRGWQELFEAIGTILGKL